MPSILLVDDEASLLDLGKLYLEKNEDFKVDTAISATKAIEMMAARSYDVIVSDYEMSGMNGIDFLKKIRSDGDDTPFIIFTGRSREEVVIDALNAGASYYIQKGGQAKAQFSELISKIRKAAEYRRKEKELLKTTRYLNDVYRTVQDGISLLDSDFVIRDINHAMEGWYGSREDLIGRKCHHVYHGKDGICDFCPTVEAIKTKKPVSRVIPGGRGRNIEKFELFAHPLLDENGDVTGVLEFVRDLTPRLKTEDALRKAEDIYSIFMDYAEEIIWTTDSELRYESISPSVHRISGVRPEEAIGKEFLYPVHPDDAISVRMRVEGLIESGGLESMDVRLVTPEGYKWFNVIAKPILNDNGEFLGLIGASRCIHDRKMVEQQLRMKEEMYRLMIENSLDIIWTMNLNGDLTYISPSLEHITGHEVSHFMAKGLLNFIHPKDRPEVEEELNALIESDLPSTTVIVRARHTDGIYNWYQSLISHLRDEIGDPIGLIGISRNINRQRAAEERYQTLFSSMTDAFALHEIILDDNGTPIDYRFLDVNPAFVRMTGLSKKEVIGKTVREVLPATEDKWIDIYGNVALTQEPLFFCSYSQEFQSFFQVYAFSPQRKKFVTLFDDVTSVVENSRRLLESERRLNLAMEGTDVGLWDWDMKNGMVKQSPRSMEMVGMESVETDVPLEEWASLYHPDDIAVIDKAVEDHLLDCRKKFEVTYRIRHSNGNWVWIKARGKLIRDIYGEPVRFVGTNMDVTDEMEARRSLVESNNKLQTLASITRHDILNNLMVIKGYLELLESGEIEDTATLFKNVQHAAGMIENNISFSRDYHKLGQQESQWISLTEVVCELADERLEVDCRLSRYEVFADPMMPKVFNNLIDNTERHAPESTKIKIRCMEKDSNLIIVYEDDGPGIPEDEKERIFWRGYGKHTGHGLFLAREILSFTGIGIKEVGRFGAGARFEVTVPPGRWREKKMV